MFVCFDKYVGMYKYIHVNNNNVVKRNDLFHFGLFACLPLALLRAMHKVFYSASSAHESNVKPFLEILGSPVLSLNLFFFFVPSQKKLFDLIIAFSGFIKVEFENYLMFHVVLANPCHIAFWTMTLLLGLGRPSQVLDINLAIDFYKNHSISAKPHVLRLRDGCIVLVRQYVLFCWRVVDLPRWVHVPSRLLQNCHWCDLWKMFCRAHHLSINRQDVCPTNWIPPPNNLMYARPYRRGHQYDSPPIKASPPVRHIHCVLVRQTLIHSWFPWIKYVWYDF
mmetsp:Transcript_7376/g.10469  ORF Transcript_7376/g.10469 Transcript_7376/m.10469 type:complete len:279 (+) Transcript_7376:96-932(+)